MRAIIAENLLDLIEKEMGEIEGHRTDAEFLALCNRIAGKGGVFTKTRSLFLRLFLMSWENKMIHEIVRNIIETQKVDDWEPKFEAFCRLTEYVRDREIAQFNKGYEMAERHFKIVNGASLADLTMEVIDKHGGLREPPLCAC